MGHNLKLLKAPGSIMDAKKDFDYCRSLINFNHKYPFEEHYVEKQWNVHTCFHPCKPKVYDEKNKTNVFQFDTRPACDENTDQEEFPDHDHILCLNPYLNKDNCEKFYPKT